MRYGIKSSKRILSISIAAITLSVPFAVQAAEFGEYGKETLIELINNYSGRMSGTAKEVGAANFMFSRMNMNGYDSSVIVPFSYTRSAINYNSNNVVVTKKGTGTGKTLYVGAHYDSALSSMLLDRSNLQGLDDNASGASVLTELVKNLSGVDTEHNLTFIAFGSEETGLRGSQAFVAGLSAAQKQNAIGMLNLDSLITGDFMYANAGGTATVASPKVALRNRAIAIAKEMGIELKMNPGLIVPPATVPYRPAGVGCCSDQVSFDNAGIEVVGFEATNWSAGPDYDGYTQTENPLIPGGSTWHDPNEDNWAFLTSILGAERVDQRMRDFARILSRLIVEATNADLLASSRSGGRLMNKVHESVNMSHSQLTSVLDRRYLVLDQAERAPGTFEVWTDGNYLYSPKSSDDYTPAQDIQRGQVGVYADYQINSKLSAGGGVFYTFGKDRSSDQEGTKVDSDGFSAALYASYGKGAGWWVSGDASYGWYDLDTERRVMIGGGDTPIIIDNTEKGSTTANTTGLRVQTGWTLTHNNIEHGPYGAINYIHTRIKGYTEDGTNRTSLSFNTQSNDSVEAHVGYQLAAKLESAAVKWGPYVRGAYVQELADGRFDRIDVTSYADGSTRSVWVGDQDKSFARFTVGTSVEFTPKFGAYLELGSRAFSDDGSRFTTNVGLQYAF